MEKKQTNRERKREKRPVNKAKHFPGVGFFFFSLAFTEMQMFYKQITFLKNKRVSTKPEGLGNS